LFDGQWRDQQSQPYRQLTGFQRYSILFAAVAYFLGWMHLYYYLHEFRVDIFAVDIPFQYFFVYAFVALRLMFDAHFWWTVLVILGVVFLTLAPRWILPSLGIAMRSPLFAFGTAACWLVALVLTFGLGQLGSYSTALLRAKSIRTAPPAFIEFVFKDPTQLEIDDDTAALLAFDPTTNRVATLILETQDRYFVLVQAVAVETEEELVQTARVIEVSRGDVLYSKTRR
jgi:hypothetical protein